MTQYFGEPIFGDAVFGTNAENLERIVTSSVGVQDSEAQKSTTKRVQTDAEGVRDPRDQKVSSKRTQTDSAGLTDDEAQKTSSKRTLSDQSSVRDPRKPTAFLHMTGGPFEDRTLLRKLRATHEVTYSPKGSPLPTVAQLQAGGYDLFVIDGSFNGVPAAELTRAYEAYDAGISVWTTGNDTTSTAGNPIWTGAASVARGTLDPVVPVGTHPVSQGWASFPDSDAGIYQTGVRASAHIVAHWTMDGTATHAAVIAEQHATNGARYVHAQPYSATHTQAFHNAVVGWLMGAPQQAYRPGVTSALTARPVFTDVLGLTDSQRVAQTYVSRLISPLGLSDANFTTQTFRLQVTDAVGIVDANQRQVNSTRFQTDPVQATDQVQTAGSYKAFIQEAVNGADPPINRVVNASRTQADLTGSTDTSTGAESYFRTATEPVGLRDAVLTKASYPRFFADAVRVPDATAQKVNAARVHPDGMAISEPVSGNGRTFKRLSDAPDKMGVADSVVYFLRNDGVPQDLVVVDDDLVATFTSRQRQTDTSALSDGVRQKQTANPRPISATGLTDPVERASRATREAQDAVGLADSYQTGIQYHRQVTDTVGTTDKAASVSTARPFIFDAVTASDTHGQGLRVVRSIAEPLGLSEGLITRLRVVLSDITGVTDGDPVKRLDARRTLADANDVRDPLSSQGQQFKRPITDSAGLAEVFDGDLQRDGRLYETTGITDSLKVTLTRELTESIAVLEPGFGSATNYSAVITEQVLLREEVYRTPQGPDTGPKYEQQIFGAPIFGDPVFGTGLTAVVVDSAGLTDSLRVVVTTSRRVVDPIGTRDSLSRSSTSRQRPVEPVGLTDPLGVSLQRRIQENAGLSDSVSYLKFRLIEPTDTQHTRDALRQSQSAVRRPEDSAGLDDVLRPSSTARRDDTDPVGLTDAIAVTRRYQITDSVGVTDTERQRFTHARVIADAAGIQDVEDDLFGARPLQTDPVGIRDATLVELIPPGLVRYGHLRPVFPGKPYVWSIQARRVGTHAARAALEVRWHNKNLQEFKRDSPVSVDLDSAEPRRIDIRVQAPEGAYYASLYFGHANSRQNDEIDWDSAQWEQGEVPTAYGPKPDEILPGAIQNTMLALGAVTTDRVKAGAITNSLIAVGAIDARTLAADSVTNDALAPGSVNTEQLVVGSVVAGAIAAGAIVADKIAANAITAGKIAADAIGAREIVANSITATEIAANAITANEIAANAITASELAAGAVTADKIEANTISGDKIVANTITGSHIQAGSVHADRLQAKTISAEQIAAGAIVAETIAAGAIIAEKIAVGAVVADTIAANAITTEKINALAIKADHLDSNAIRSHHIQADAIQAIHILAGSITADELSATAITGKIITGGIFQTGVQGEDRIVISAVDGKDQYGRNYRDVIQWRDGSNRITGEIRGFLGDVGIYGIQLNSHVQLGHPDSVVYQYGRRSITQGRSKVRMGTTTGVCDGNGNFEAAIGPFEYTDANGNVRRFTPSVVVCTMGTDVGTNLFVGFAVTSWDYSKVYGKMRYLTGLGTDTTSLANPGAGTQFAIRYYAECGA